MAEQFRFNQRRRQGPAVHRHEGLVRPRTLRVDRSRYELLSSPTFSQNQHVVALRGGLQYQPINLLHLPRSPDNVGESLTGLQLLAQQVVFPSQLLHLDEPLEDLAKFLDSEGLGDVVVGAELYRLDGRGDRSVTGHDHHRCLRIPLLDGAQQLEAVHPGHADVGQDNIRGAAFEDRQRARARFSLLDVET